MQLTRTAECAWQGEVPQVLANSWGTVLHLNPPNGFNWRTPFSPQITESLHSHGYLGAAGATEAPCEQGGPSSAVQYHAGGVRLRERGHKGESKIAGENECSAFRRVSMIVGK